MQCLSHNKLFIMKNFFLSILLCIIFSFCVLAQNQKNTSKQALTTEQLISKFCSANVDKYKQIKKWIKDNKGKNTSVQPLAMDPSCYDCHNSDTYTKDTAKINKWMYANSKPESDMIRSMLQIQRMWEQLGQPYCSAGFTEEEFTNAERDLGLRIYDRVVAMAEKYHREPKYATAGIKYLLSITREMMMLGALSNDDNSLSLAAEWLSFCYDKFDQRLFKEYQYQLYSTYLDLLRSCELLGGQRNENNIYTELKKLDDFMHFKLKINFEATGHDERNGKWHALVSGETEIQCKRQEGTCYVWEPVDGKNMEFKVIDVVFSSDQGVVVYQGPPTFSTPISIRVNMCDSQPKFKIAFSSFGSPAETYKGDNGESQAPVLYGLAIATLGSANVQRMQNNISTMKQKTDKFQGKEEEVDAAAKRLRDHENDPSYKNSAQGKADMALMQQMAKSLGIDLNKHSEKQRNNVNNLRASVAKQREINSKLTEAGYVGSSAYSKDQQDLAKLKEKTDMTALTESAGLDENMLEIEAPFLIGSKIAVDKIQKDKIQKVVGSKGGWDYGQFTVTLENTPVKYQK
jgi:hypothetical protein